MAAKDASSKRGAWAHCLLLTSGCLALLGLFPAISFTRFHTRGLSEVTSSLRKLNITDAHSKADLVSSSIPSTTTAARGNETIAGEGKVRHTTTKGDNRTNSSTPGVSMSPSGENVANGTRPEPHKPHPHAGARDAHGNYGFVADVTLVRKWIMQRYAEQREQQFQNKTSNSSISLFRFLPFDSQQEMEEICELAPGKGFEGEAGMDLLVNHIKFGGEHLDDGGSGSVATPSNQTILPAPSTGRYCAPSIHTTESKTGFGQLQRRGGGGVMDSLQHRREQLSRLRTSHSAGLNCCI